MYKVKNGSCPDYIFWLFNISSNQFNFRTNDLQFLEFTPRVTVSIRSDSSDQYSGQRLIGNSELKNGRSVKKSVIRKVDRATHILLNKCINCTLCNS